MKTLREFRKDAKVSQSAMADMLKTTRSQVAMAERGLRPLPPHCVKRLECLQTFSAESGKMPIEKQLELIESEQMLAYEARDVWESMLAKNNWQQYKLQNELKVMQHDFAAVLQRSKAFWAAVEILPAVDGAPAEIIYMQDRQKNIQKKLLTCGRIAQLRLQLSIDLLLAEARLLNQYLQSTTVETGNPM